MKRDFKKLLAFALASYAVTTSVKADNLTASNDYALGYVKIPDFYNDAYLLTGGTSLLMRENAQREDPFGGNINVVLGWEATVCGDRGSKKLGKGFSADALSDSFNVMSNPTVNALNAGRFIHMYFPASGSADYNPFVGDSSIKGSQPNVTMSDFEAKHRRWFADISYSQDLGSFYEGLRFNISTTLVNVKNNLSVTFSGTEPKGVSRLDAPTGAGTPLITVGAGANYYNNVTVKGFFTGTTTSASGDQYNAQKDLQHGLFGAGDQSESGITDIRASLSLDVLDNDSAKVVVALDGVIPTGRELKCINLFEPMVGNRHFKLGVSARADASLADGSDYSSTVSISGLWHYAFARTVPRLPWDQNERYGHYDLGYTADTNVAIILAPIIDIVLAAQPKVNVKPGQNVDVIANINLEKGALIADLGYHLHWSAAESNDSYTDMTGLCRAYFDNTPGVATERTKSTADTNWSTTNGGWTYSVAQNFKSSSASQTTHELYLSLGFLAKEWQYPSSLSIRGGYNIAQDRTRTPERWTLALKGSFCF